MRRIKDVAGDEFDRKRFWSRFEQLVSDIPEVLRDVGSEDIFWWKSIEDDLPSVIPNAAASVEEYCIWPLTAQIENTVVYRQASS